MRSLWHVIDRYWGWLGLLVLACSGCTDTASLCDARLTPINVNVAAAAPVQGRSPHP